MGGKTSKVTQTNEPPDWAEPLFVQGAESAQWLYRNRIGGNVFQGNTVVGQGDRTRNALSNMFDVGRNMPTFAPSQNTYSAISAANTDFTPRLSQIASGIDSRDASTAGFDGAMTRARDIADPTNMLTGIASGTGGVRTEGDYRNILASAGGRSAAEQYLTDTASGSYLDDGNPYYRRRLDKEIDDARAKMQTMYAGKGRYGSMTAQRGIGEMTGNMLLQGLESDYNRERENQLRAVGMIDSQRNASIGNRLAAVSGITGVQGQNIGNQMAAAGQMSGARAQEAGLLNQIASSRFGAERANQDARLAASQAQAGILGQASQNRLAEMSTKLNAANMLEQSQQQEYANRLTGAQSQLQAGQLTDEAAQKQLDDNIARFYANDNAAWNRLAMLFSAAQGSAGNYGTSVQTSRQPVDFMSIFGSLISDRRLKTNAIRYGSDPRGFGLYEFSYRITPDQRFRGVMADEVERVDPAAVVDLGAYKVVNYERLGLKMEAV